MKKENRFAFAKLTGLLAHLLRIHRTINSFKYVQYGFSFMHKLIIPLTLAKLAICSQRKRRKHKPAATKHFLHFQKEVGGVWEQRRSYESLLVLLLSIRWKPRLTVEINIHIHYLVCEKTNLRFVWPRFEETTIQTGGAHWLRHVVEVNFGCFRIISRRPFGFLLPPAAWPHKTL